MKVIHRRMGHKERLERRSWPSMTILPTRVGIGIGFAIGFLRGRVVEASTAPTHQDIVRDHIALFGMLIYVYSEGVETIIRSVSYVKFRAPWDWAPP